MAPAVIDLSGEIPPDPFDPLLDAWNRRDWTGRDAEGDVPGWRTSAITIAGYDAWLLQRRVAGEGIYGSGESFLGLDLAGKQRILINRETNGAGGVDLAYLNIPFVWSRRRLGSGRSIGRPGAHGLALDRAHPDRRSRTGSGHPHGHPTRDPRRVRPTHRHRVRGLPDWPSAHG